MQNEMSALFVGIDEDRFYVLKHRNTYCLRMFVETGKALSRMVMESKNRMYVEWKQTVDVHIIKW